LEEVVLPAYPVVQRVALRLKELAPIAMLSGSGAAVVGVFSEKSWRREILAEFADPAWFVRVVAAHPAGVLFRDEEPPEPGGHP
jgi:4-diphosphocytidyl-2C-methyl-D-erythritol kinase